MDAVESEPTVGIRRTMDLLYAILLDGGISNVGAIAAHIRLPLSTVHRQIALLEQRGFLVRTGRGRYVAGLALATTIPPDALDLALTATCRPVLKRLARETGHTAHLGVFRSNMVTYLVKEGGDGSQVFTKEAMQLEAYCSSIGKVLLSQLTPDDLSAYLAAGPLISLTSRTITDPVQLREHLNLVREQDYAVDDREISEDINCLAVPIRNGNAPIAAISLAATEPIINDPQALLAKLRHSAADVSRIMSNSR